MKYRRLGKSNLRVSVIGLGTWQFGGEWGKTWFWSFTPAALAAHPEATCPSYQALRDHQRHGFPDIDHLGKGQDRPIHLEADRVTVDDAKQLATFSGNVGRVYQLDHDVRLSREEREFNRDILRVRADPNANPSRFIELERIAPASTTR